MAQLTQEQRTQLGFAVEALAFANKTLRECGLRRAAVLASQAHAAAKAALVKLT